MPALVLVGAQWGDEGKGKATDLLGGSVDYVVRYQGGNNAGHTVVIGDQKYALHLLPSGILTPGCTPVIGNGVVVDLGVLFEEIDGLEERGVIGGRRGRRIRRLDVDRRRVVRAHGEHRRRRGGVGEDGEQQAGEQAREHGAVCARLPARTKSPAG